MHTDETRRSSEMFFQQGLIALLPFPLNLFLQILSFILFLPLLYQSSTNTP